MDLINKIIEASKSNTLTFFVGAGVSRTCGVPNWKELIDALCDEMHLAKRNFYSNEEYLSIPQKYYYWINEDRKAFYDFVNKTLSFENVQPNIIHQLLCTIAPNSFLTTNYDDLIEKAAIQNCMTYKSIPIDKDISNIKGDRFILKVHGDFRNNNIVLKEEDYLNYSENFKLIETILKSIFSTNTIVFIGYGVNDYNIKLILNWSKNLLKDRFNNPIFIYTDNEDLSDIEIAYQKSRGLSILDFRNFLSSSIDAKSVDYIDRYTLVLNNIVAKATPSLEHKDKFQLFNLLYELLQPLNKFGALKTSDIKQQLSNFANVDERGIISRYYGKPDIFELFYEINSDESVLSTHDVNFINKYNVIKQVFQKAFIGSYQIDKKTEMLNLDNHSFADSNYISFNFFEMEKYTKKKTNDLNEKYRQAFYLVKLYRYTDAFWLYKDIAMQSFYSQNFLLYFLAQSNKINIYRIMKSINNHFLYFNSFNFDETDKIALEKALKENIFDSLPNDFKKEYDNFSDLFSATYLYKNAYKSSLESNKLISNINKSVIEMGLSTVDLSICRINNLLHFTIGNYLFIDEFSEFKATVRNILIPLIYINSIQNYKKIENPMFHFGNDIKIHLDEKDFFCLIEYFSDKEIADMIDEYKIDRIIFVNIEKIEISIKKIYEYYDKVLSKSEDVLSKMQFQIRIKNCTLLLRYINVSETLLEYVYNILFKYNFNDIYISDKLILVNEQIYKFNIHNRKIRAIMINNLFYHFSLEIEAIKINREYDIPCKNKDFNYWNIARYISPSKKFKSERISNFIIKILNDCENFPLYKLTECIPYLNSVAKYKLLSAIRERNKNDFNFSLFQSLLGAKCIGKTDIVLLKEYIKINLEKPKQNGIVIIGGTDFIDEFSSVGYWCLCGLLDKDEFKDFIGFEDVFDFYFDPKTFDYNKFDVAWLINLLPNTHNKICKTKTVQKNIQKCIKDTLREQINISEKDKLTNILLSYYL